MYKINAYIVKFDVKSATCMVFKKQKQRQKKIKKTCWNLLANNIKTKTIHRTEEEFVIEMRNKIKKTIKHLTRIMLRKKFKFEFG